MVPHPLILLYVVAEPPGPMVQWKDPVLCLHHTCQHQTASKTNTREATGTTIAKAEWRVSRKKRDVLSLVVTRTVGEAKSLDESDQRIDLTVGLMNEAVAVGRRSAQKASVSVEAERNVVATVADETAKEKASRDLDENRVKAAGASVAPAMKGELQEGMSAIGGAEEAAAEPVEETMAARECVIPRTRHTATRRGGDRFPPVGNWVVE